ncbi:alpha/beta hydrolase [Tautonia plasticadhaerens]|uniref:Carboxylesterase NlhH n=1 Tax=Tautonia plasticadhaerens TaxID=2527974 RepID=A0A518H7K5_9BACT|nr:alpha/beta hydrolase [Tautonia plasticadhaerens]QDV36771.1 Carboxylesterase NlhH [Tautonia plasticadhaerens]
MTRSFAFHRVGPVIFGVVVLLSRHSGAQEDEPRFEALEDLTYATVDGQELKLDLARPTGGGGPFPAIVAIHGGAWRAGDKADLRDLLAELAGFGYVSISPQYRFCPEHPFPAQIHDVKAAVRWLRSNAEAYSVDPDRIGAVGFSAGGHLALLLGVTEEEDGLEGVDPRPKVSSSVQAVVNYFGPTDLAAEDLPNISVPLRNDLIGGTPEEKPEETRRASPLTYVSDGDPPILTFQGTADPLVPPSQATSLAEAMAEVGVGGRVELMIGAGHGWGDPELVRTRRATIEFFDAHLKGEGDIPRYLREE